MNKNMEICMCGWYSLLPNACACCLLPRVSCRKFRGGHHGNAVFRFARVELWFSTYVHYHKFQLDVATTDEFKEVLRLPRAVTQRNRGNERISWSIDKHRLNKQDIHKMHIEYCLNGSANWTPTHLRGRRPATTPSPCGGWTPLGRLRGPPHLTSATCEIAYYI